MGEQIFFQCNERFADLFFSSEELKEKLWEWHLPLSLFLGR